MPARSVLLKFNKDIISDEEWCVSAAALRFMRSVLSNHFLGEEQHMLPCCGHYMIPSNDNQSVGIYGCCNGIDFDVLHEDEEIVIKTEDSKTYCFTFSEYREFVLGFANEVERFYSDSPKRNVFNDDYNKNIFDAFNNEWNRLKAEINSDNFDSSKNTFIESSDHISITEKDILQISSNGISYNGGYINFRECAYYFKKKHGGEGKCVGERDITTLNPTFTLYTNSH